MGRGENFGTAIFFKDKGYKESIINMKPTDTLHELKETIKDKVGHELDLLTFAGKNLTSKQDEKTLEELHIKDMSKIQEIGRVMGGVENE